MLVSHQWNPSLWKIEVKSGDGFTIELVMFCTIDIYLIFISLVDKFGLVISKTPHQVVLKISWMG